MLYDLRLTITYRFERPAGGGRQMLRILPSPRLVGQKVLSSEVSLSPLPLEEHHFRDFFGTEVVEAVLPPHLTEMRVEMRAQVEKEVLGPSLDVSPPPAALAAELLGLRDLGPDSPHHFLPISPRIPFVPDIADFAADSMRESQSLLTAIEDLGQALHAAMTFDSEATEVDTPIAEAFAGRRGVCQDFAQIMIAGLRSQGIPAGYVAGYLRTLPPEGRPRLVGTDAMHAWVRAWAGAQIGWVEYDATNRCWANGDHIVVGYGRDYSDVAPVTGHWRLDGAQRGSHSVDIVEISGP